MPAFDSTAPGRRAGGRESVLSILQNLYPNFTPITRGRTTVSATAN
jgi:hypothetical protein